MHRRVWNRPSELDVSIREIVENYGFTYPLISGRVVVIVTPIPRPPWLQSSLLVRLEYPR